MMQTPQSATLLRPGPWCPRNLFGERWSLLVVLALMSGPMRYTDLAGITVEGDEAAFDDLVRAFMNTLGRPRSRTRAATW